jgi:hypothetical protein
MPQLNNKEQSPNKDNSLDQISVLQSLLDMQKSNISPYQKGVEKALKESGEQHAMEAIQQGVPAEHIVEQSGLQSDPIKILSGLVSMPQKSTEQSNANIQQQASGIVDPHGRSLLGNILNTLGNVTGVNAMNTAVDSVRLSNLDKAQEIIGQKPLQVGDYQKLVMNQALELQKQGRLQADQLMTKFEQASQPFITQRDAYGRIQASVSDPSPAGDLSLIFNYLKVLDPGSTVREGEYANVKNAGGIPDKIRNMYNRVMSGEALNQNQRNDFVNRANKLFKSAEAQQKKTTEEFSRLGKRNGIDPKVFIRDTGLAGESSTKEDNGFVSTPGGNKFKVIK